MTRKTKVAIETAVQTIIAAEVAAKVEKKSIPYNYGDLLVELKTKSAVVRKLAAEEFSRGDIAKFVGIRYQHVRNILVTPLKKTETV